jgi:hypothetical protein
MNKKITSSALAALMIAGSTSFSVFAAMANGTVVIGTKAFDLAYANNPANATEITNAVVAANGAIFVKNFEGNWINNATGATVLASTIPAVTYKSATGVVTSFDAGDKDAVTTLSVTSVSAVNLKEIEVKFSAPVDKTTAENKDAYALTKGLGAVGIDSAKLSDDGMTVTLVPTVALTNQATDYKLGVSGVKVAVGTMSVTVKDLKFTPVDAALPMVTSVSSLGNKAVKISFSEPVDITATVASTFKIDDKVVSGTLTTSGRDVIIQLFNTLTAGTHKITINNNVKDFVNYQLVEVTKEFTVVADTVAPTIASVKDVTLESATVVFSEEVQDTEALLATNYLWKQGSTDKKATSVTKIDSKTFKISFTANKLPGYTTDLYVLNIKDFSGNVIAASTKIAVTATLDQVRPEVLTSVFDETAKNKMTLTFNKSIDTTSFKSSNVIIKKADGTVVSNGYTAVIVDKSVVINFSTKLAAGSYTFELSGLKDVTLLQNAMMPYTTSIVAKNTTAPNAAATITGSLPNYIITFDKAMDVESSYSILNPENYYITYSTATASNITGRLPEGTNVSPINDNKGVIITLPSGVTAVTELVVQGVKDTSGNLLAGYAKKYTSFTTTLNVLAAKATASKTVVVKMNQPVGNVNKANFTITGTNANSAAVTAAVVDSTNNTLVKLTLDTALDAKLGNVNVVATAPGASDASKTTGITNAVLATSIMAVVDAIAPSVKVNSDDVSVVGSVDGAIVGSTYNNNIGFQVTNAANTAYKVQVAFTENILSVNNAVLGENFKLYKEDGVQLTYGLDYAVTIANNIATIALADGTGTTMDKLAGYNGKLKVVVNNDNENITDATTATDFDGTTEIDSFATGIDTSEALVASEAAEITFDYKAPMVESRTSTTSAGLVITLSEQLSEANGADLAAKFTVVDTDASGAATITSAIYNDTAKTITFVLAGVTNTDVVKTSAGIVDKFGNVLVIGTRIATADATDLAQ